jgi:hypothetical protein
MMKSMHTPVVLGPLLQGIVTTRMISIIEVGAVASVGFYAFFSRRIIGVPRSASSLAAGALAGYLYDAYTLDEIAA